MSKVLTHSTKSYIKIFFVGILVGCICRLGRHPKFCVNLCEGVK